MAKRRDFIRTSIMGAAGAAMGGIGFSAKSYASIVGANERVNVAVIGIHGMGQNHIQAYARLPNAKVAALCDVDSNLFDGCVKKHFAEKGLGAPKLYSDLRKLFATDAQSVPHSGERNS